MPNSYKNLKNVVDINENNLLLLDTVGLSPTNRLLSILNECHLLEFYKRDVCYGSRVLF